MEQQSFSFPSCVWRFFLIALLLAACVALLNLPTPAHTASLTLTVEGTLLKVTTAEGRIVQGKDLVGAILTISYGGAPVRARIAAVELDPEVKEGDVLLYDLRLIEPDGREQPLCNPDPGGRRAGFPLAGRTDTSGALHEADAGVFEFVCISGAQGKCVRFGYAPWRRSSNGQPLRDHFNACVRMVRADYCGDGSTLTRDGTLIGYGDWIGLNTFDPASAPGNFHFEAAWNADGAVCIAKPRLSDSVTLDDIVAACPRFAGKTGPDECNLSKAQGLIYNYSE